MESKTLRVKIEILDEQEKILETKHINDWSVCTPTTAAELGLPPDEQLKLMASIQQSVLNSQADFLK